MGYLPGLTPTKHLVCFSLLCLSDPGGHVFQTAGPQAGGGPVDLHKTL